MFAGGAILLRGSLVDPPGSRVQALGPSKCSGVWGLGILGWQGDKGGMTTGGIVPNTLAFIPACEAPDKREIRVAFRYNLQGFKRCLGVLEILGMMEAQRVL